MLAQTFRLTLCRWQKRITIGGGINAFHSVLGLVLGIRLAADLGRFAAGIPAAGLRLVCLCISLCILGCVIMIAADAQKYFTLRVKRGLIIDGT